MATWSSSSSSDDEDNPSLLKTEVKKKAIRFSKAQITCLETYYKLGMTSTRKSDLSLIMQAAKDSNLSVEQIKVGWYDTFTIRFPV